MIHYQGIPCTIYAYSKKNASQVKIRYTNHSHYDLCDGNEHCGLTTVSTEDLVIQSFDKKGELDSAIRKAPYFFDKDGLHVNDLPQEPVETTTTGTTPKSSGESKYKINLDQLKELFEKGHKKSEVCTMLEVPFWFLDKFMKANGLTIQPPKTKGVK